MSEEVTMKNRPKLYGRNFSEYYYENRNWFEGFEKQEEEKQNISTIQILEKINEIKDMNILSKTKENGAFIFGFMKGYLHRGNEILGIIEKEKEINK